MVVVDIGANIGYYTLIAAKLIGDNSKVYAFEPEPESYKLLAKNIKTNDYANVVTIQKAVSDKTERIKLFLDKSNLANPSLAQQNICDKNQNGFLEVETITLDDFFREVVKNFKVDIIKMDTQGAESLILEGAEKIIKNNKLKIIMEFWPKGLENMGTGPLRLLKRLENYGFRIKFIDETNKCLKELESERIVEMCKNLEAPNGDDFVNLLLEK